MERDSKFFNESRIFKKRVDKVQASLDAPDEQLVHQAFDIPKRQVEKIDTLVKKRELDLRVAEERRFRIMISAWRLICGRVLSNWSTRDRLDELFARYHRTVYGREPAYSISKDVRRREALKVFEEVHCEIAAF